MDSEIQKRARDGRYSKHTRCDCCAQVIRGEHITDSDVCGGSDGPGFFLCSRRKCMASRDDLTAEERRILYTAGRVRAEVSL